MFISYHSIAWHIGSALQMHSSEVPHGLHGDDAAVGAWGITIIKKEKRNIHHKLMIIIITIIVIILTIIVIIVIIVYNSNGGR